MGAERKYSTFHLLMKLGKLIHMEDIGAFGIKTADINLRNKA
jgi:hypothetical protein